MMVAVLLLGGAAGCDDGHRGLIDSTETADMGPLDPGDPEPQGPSDKGADWQVDAADDAPDAGSWRPGDPDDGAEIFEDAAVPDASPVIDASPEDEIGDYRLPDDPVIDGDSGAGGTGVYDREPAPPEQGEIDPTALRMPRCGTFGPAEQLDAGPSRTTTYLHAGPGVLFGEPALSGCQPSRLRNQNDGRLLQEMFFEYRWQRVVGWLWRIYTLDGQGYRLPGRVVYGGAGRVIWASYACVGSIEPEVYTFRYRDDQLLEVDLHRPEDCQSMAAGIGQSVQYRYGDHRRWPEARLVELADGHMDEVQFEYELDPGLREQRVVAIREYGPLEDLLLERRFVYDADGRVIEETRRPFDGGRVDRIRYTYDAEGRLVERTSTDDALQIGYDAAGDIEFVHATNPSYVVRELRFPERSLLEPVGMDAEPVPADDGWR